MSAAQQSEEIDALTSIWERALRRGAIGTSDDFFDMGGNTCAAIHIFSEIADKFGCDLAPATICEASTIASLAQAIAAPKSIGSLVPLNVGREDPPLFVTHGIGSSVVDLVPLARHVKTIHPIYGMEGRGNNGRDIPLDRIEEMAKSFVDSVRTIQSRGPYYLIGYSLGGLVTLEMAQLLSQSGEDIGFLGLLDSYPDRRALSIGQHVRLLGQLARRKLRYRNSAPTPSQTHAEDGGLGGAMQRVKEAQYRALRNYRPRFYDGKVTFIRAAVPSYFPKDPVPVWSPLVRDLTVETVPGDHVGLLSAQVVEVASALSRSLQVASQKA